MHLGLLTLIQWPVGRLLADRSVAVGLGLSLVCFGGGTLLLVPFTKDGAAEAALPAPGAATAPANGVVQWKCLGKDAPAFVGVSVGQDALPTKYLPAECK